jgi:hypothetical protein
MNYENYEYLAITIQNSFTPNLRLVNRYHTFRKSQTYIKNVNYNYFISQNKETQNIPLICFLSQKMKIMKMKGGCVPYNFQNCIKFCQNILFLSEYAKNHKYMSSFNRDKGPTYKVHNMREH